MKAMSGGNLPGTGGCITFWIVITVLGCLVPVPMLFGQWAKPSATDIGRILSALNGPVSDIVISGTDIYVGGFFTDAGGNPNADAIAKWNGNSWEALGPGLNGGVVAIGMSGSDIYVGGEFLDAGGIANADHIARWDGLAWNALGVGLNQQVKAIALAGQDLYVGGEFTDVNGNDSADHIARWDGTGWHPMGLGFNTVVYAIAVSDSGVFAGGTFTNTGVTSIQRIARWDGSNWDSLGGGLNWTVSTIAVSGIDLYAGGEFSNAGGDPYADYVARWDGTSWHALGTGTSGGVDAIAVSGSSVYVGGSFLHAGGNSLANRIAIWDGSSWANLGPGMDSTQAQWVLAIALAGSDVYAGGWFTNAGANVSADYIARWDGSFWHAVGNGEPTAQPTNLTFSDVGFTSLGLQFTASAGGADGYLVLKKEGTSPPTGIPADGVDYSPGTWLVDAEVWQKGPATNYHDSSMAVGTAYSYAIYAYNDTGSQTNYLTSNPLSGCQSTLRDTIGPTISGYNASPFPAMLGQVVTIFVTITDNHMVSGAVVEYKSGIENSFHDPMAMSKNGNVFSAMLPGSAASNAGLVFRITGVDYSENHSVLAGLIPVATTADAVTTQSPEGGAYPIGFPAGKWRMLSVPLDLDDDEVPTVLAVLGPSGNSTWRLFDGNQDVSATAHFTLGKSFWLKQVHVPGGQPLALGAGRTAHAAYPITLFPGWNQIGNPYTFPVDWEQHTDASDNIHIKGPIAYDGTKYIGIGQTDGDATPFTGLTPWDGYWVYNAASGNQVLTIDPSGVIGSCFKTVVTQPEWNIQFIVRNERSEDQYNFIGAADDASDGEDKYDLPELPVIGEYVSLSFDHPFGDTIAYYTMEFRPVGDQGGVWDMVVRSNVRSVNRLSWLSGNLPAGFVVGVLNVSDGEVITDTGYAFSVKTETHPVRFKVWVGTEEYVAGAMNRFVESLPRLFKLHKNSPNPFNPSTTIPFDVARAARVKICVYNVLGQEVATLTDRYYDAGQYSVRWNGTDQRGRQVSSGIYVYRMETREFKKSGKMVMVR